MKKIILTLVLLCVALPAMAEERESTMARILRTNTLRCGYYVFPPVTYRDANTGKLSGFSVDMMEAIGRAAGIKIEWAEEVNFANWVAAAQANRFDVACTPMWPDIPLSRVVSFTIPFFYAGLSPLVRADDERFKGNDLDRLNQADVTFLTQDGNAIAALTQAVFDKAKISNMPASMDGPTVLQEIVTKKADAILLDRNAEIEYNKNNPVKLRLVAPQTPVKVQAFTLAVERSQTDLKALLDNAIQELLNDGSVDRMLKKWETEPGQFLRVSKPYEAKK